MVKKKGVDLENVSFRVFVSFEDEKFIYYRNLGLAMKPDPWDLPEIESWTFGKVKELQMMFDVPAITMDSIPTMLSFAYSHIINRGEKNEKKIDRPPSVFWEMKWHQAWRYYNHIASEVKKIQEKEKVLAYEPDADQIEAGIHRINRFGVLATLDLLSDGNVLLYDEIESKPYSLIFAKLILEMEKGAYLEKLQKIKSRSKK